MKLTNFGAIRSLITRRPSRSSRGFVGTMAVCAALALTPAYSAGAAEHALAGIRVFASVHDVLARYGNPNRIITDASQFSTTTTSSTTTAQTTVSGMGQMGMGMGMGRMRAQEFGGAPGGSGFPGAGGVPGGSGIPGMPSMANPYAAPGAPGAASSDSGSGNPSAGEVMYVYNRPGGVTYDFLLSPDGRVIQITVLGYKNTTVKTGRGIQLGTLYSTMIGRYGYPEGQSSGNGVLTATYLQRAHASFQLRNNHIVGITVAAVE